MIMQEGLLAASQEFEQDPFQGIQVTGEFPSTGQCSGINTHSPFHGNYKAFSWNSQALFAAKCRSQFAKRNKANGLLNSHDFGMYQETHSQEGRIRAHRLPPNTCAIWAHGSTRQAGIGIALKHEFLANFDTVIPDLDFEEVVSGRIAILHLHGPQGNLDIVCVYMDASSSQARQTTIRKLAAALRPQSTTLTVMMGDFNFVMNPRDRWSTSKLGWADNGDNKDAELLEKLILEPFGLVEWEQSHYTCQAKGARSRIDRAYSNQHTAVKLDSNCRAYVLGWCEQLSAHRPIGMARNRGGKKSCSLQPLKPWVIKHKDFAERVQVQFKHMVSTSGKPDVPLQRLLTLKAASRHVHDRISAEFETSHPDSAEDKVCLAIMYARSLENHDLRKAEFISNCFTDLKSCSKSTHKSLYAMQGADLSSHLLGVKDLIVELFREEINDDVHEFLSNNDLDDDSRPRMKEHILKKLKRLSPCESSSINCVKDSEDNFHSTPEAMAKALCDHWKHVFKESDCDQALLNEWMNTLFGDRQDSGWSTGLAAKNSRCWKIKRRHLNRAIAMAKGSMPGPDGTPAITYKVLGEFGADILWDVLCLLQRDDAITQLSSFFSHLDPDEAKSFNESILCLLPKKPSGSDDSNGTYYEPGSTRPLSISNVDSRLLASAARCAWEPVLEKWISQAQRGFLKGRQMLHNIIDIDWISMKVSLKCKSGALMLFDFKAAFPSVSHGFLKSALNYIGLPCEALNLINAMYHDNQCYIRLHGQDFQGFCMKGGVKQGCPLSPLLFATCVDILLRMLALRIPSSVNRAFADDIATVVETWWDHAPILEHTFQEFHQISNLELNACKSICIPLWPEGRSEVKARIAQATPAWSSLSIQDCGVYLGFYTGPGKAKQSWDKPFAKFKSRVSQWSKLGGGHQYATLAYNTFAISTLMFIGQLEPPPKEVLAAERLLVTSMYPGPGNWILPEDMWYAKESFGFNKSAQSLHVNVRAAQLRVATLGCQFGSQRISPHKLRHPGTDNIFSRWRELHGCICNSEFLLRVASWKHWYDGSLCRNLVENSRELEKINVHASAIIAKIVGHNSRNWDDDDMTKIKSQFQKNAVTMIKQHSAPSAPCRIRDKVDRWRGKPYGLKSLPGHYMYSIHEHLHCISKELPPRVHAAVFRVLFNGWCTRRRFQHRDSIHNVCAFGCGDTAEDSIEHYCRCPATMKVARSYLHLDYPAEPALDIWLLSSSWLDIPDTRMGISLLIYGVYNAFNTLRHGGGSSQHQVHHLIVQHCKQGAFGHPKAMKYLDSRWRQNTTHIC